VSKIAALNIRAVIVGTLLLALYNAWSERHVLQLAVDKELEGPFSVAMHEVALGAAASLDDTADVALSGEFKRLTLDLPGSPFSLQTVIEALQTLPPLRPPRVRAKLVNEGDRPTVAVRVDGHDGPLGETRTNDKQTLAAAALDAATFVHEALRPLVAASYFFQRDAKRALEIIGTVVEPLGRRHATSSERDIISAYALWGSILTDRTDYEAAPIPLKRAIGRLHRLLASPPRRLAAWVLPRRWTMIEQDRRRLAATYLMLGHAYAGQGNWKRAGFIYSRAAHADPTWPAPHFHWGRAMEAWAAERGRPRLREAAREHYEETLRLDPAYLEASLARGQVLVVQGRSERALAEYEQTFAHSTRSDAVAADGRRAWGELLASRGRCEAALRATLFAFDVDPGRFERDATCAGIGVCRELATAGELRDGVERCDRAGGSSALGGCICAAARLRDEQFDG
jgi:tetratricopeptide (TPR) repeat protein